MMFAVPAPAPEYGHSASDQALVVPAGRGSFNCETNECFLGPDSDANKVLRIERCPLFP